MSKIDVLAVGPTGPIATKAALKQLISTSAELVKIVPVNPSPSLVSATPAYDMPAGVKVTAHSPTGRKWSAEISRTESHEFTVR